MEPAQNRVRSHRRATRLLLVLVPLLLPVVTAGPRAAPDNKRGQTFEEFVRGVRAERELWLENVSQARVSPDFVKRLERVSRGLALVVVAEDRCPDSANTVPYLAALASQAHVPLTIVDRTIGEPLMRRHRAQDGRLVTPIVVLLRDDVDVGAWVERPVALQQLFQDLATNPERGSQLANRQRWYDADRGHSALAEIAALAERTAGGAAP